jgi:hypothetical protein
VQPGRYPCLPLLAEKLVEFFVALADAVVHPASEDGGSLLERAYFVEIRRRFVGGIPGGEVKSIRALGMVRSP